MCPDNSAASTPSLEQLRQKIDGVNDAMLELFIQRMELARQVAESKRQTGKAVADMGRERAIVAHVRSNTPPELQDYATALFSVLMETSRAYQHQHLGSEADPLYVAITQALDTSPAIFPVMPAIACQGVEGSYAQLACEKLARHPQISFYSSFEEVFTAVESGACSLGVVPIENSTAGSVTAVYDLMMKHRFHIVRTARFKVDHCLLARPGVSLDDIRYVYSHPQALAQCSQFFARNPQITAVSVANTAVAAQMVAGSGSQGQDQELAHELAQEQAQDQGQEPGQGHDRDRLHGQKTACAAIASAYAGELNGLQVLGHAIQNNGANYTRFACISRDLCIYPGADRASFALVTPHRPGALYQILARLYALDINMTKLESRPVPGHDFEFIFYFDIQAPAAAPGFARLMCGLKELSQDFRFLGSYYEVV